jgi:hypothetical protein
LIKTKVWSGQVISGFLAPLLALLVSHVVVLQFLKFLKTLVTIWPDDKIKNCQACLEMEKKSV